MIRLPGHTSREVVGIRIDAAGEKRSVSRVLLRTPEGNVKVLWEATQSTFLDKYGRVFYDRKGVPFQGKK